MRCNLVDPRILTDQHLIAERRELRMIPPFLEKRLRLGIAAASDIPVFYTLGRGHMKFWLDKFKFLETRFIALTKEMQFRGFNPDLTLSLETSVAKKIGLYNDYIPRDLDIEVSKCRIVDRILQKPTWYRFHSLPISVDWITLNYFPERPLLKA